MLPGLCFLRETPERAIGASRRAGRNDSPATAQRLVELEGIDAHVNLIPLNPTVGFAGTAAAEDVGQGFQRIVLGAGIPCTFRQRRGIHVAAGCGQLETEKVKA